MRERRLKGILSDSRYGKILSLLGCGVIAGVVVAAAALPAAAMAGALTAAGMGTFDSLPSGFTSVPAPQSSFIYANDGKTLLAMLYDENRRDVPLAEVAPVMQQAIVASEDIRFFQHGGVDYKGLARALVANGSGDSAQGASTLTMQYVRQSAIYAAKTPEDVVAASERTKARKLREMKLAMALEQKLSKQQILERYLNIAPFGHGAWGIYAASHVYFAKDPKDLTLPEAALLAGLVQAPSVYDPADAAHPEKREAAVKRREHVFDQMVKAGNISAQQADAARKEPLKITDQRPSQGCVSIPYPALGAGFFCDYLYRWWLEQPAFGADAFERENRLRSGGYTIISSLDMGLQQAMKRNVDAKIKTTDKRALMLSAVEPGTGRVLAMATNRNFSLDISGNLPNPDTRKSGPGSFPNTTNPLIGGGGGVDGYQAGSTFKMFTMLAALEQGMPLNTAIDTQPTYRSKYITKDNTCPGTKFWCPSNADKSEQGRFDMWTGFGKSVNTYFVPLEERAGADRVVDVATRLGIKFRAANDRQMATDGANQWGAFTLGVSATTPVDLAGAYATLANDGVHCEPTPVVEIRDPSGKRLDTGKPKCANAVTADVARAAIDAARCPVGDKGGLNQCRGASTASAVSATVGKPVFGKTGTTDTNESATLVAATRQVAVAGMEAIPDLRQSGADHNHVDGAVAETLRDAMAGKPAQDFPAPSSRLAFGR
jgi:membrane peptidoglycan carboxypeptidase